VPLGYPFPAELREQARQLHADGLNNKTIALRLGVSQATVLRWLDPEREAKQRLAARDYKHRQRKRCAECGTKIWYTSTLCNRCSIEQQKRHKRWTRERVIAAIQAWNTTHGRPPTATEWMRAGPDHPAATAIYGREASAFPSWNAAIAAAGFTPRFSGPGPGKSTWSKEEARQLRKEGLTDVEIGRRFGVSASAIFQALGVRGDKTPTTAHKRRTRAQRIADLQQAVKGEQDGNWDGARNNHD